MKNISINKYLILALIISTVATVVPQEENPKLWRRITTFAKKHQKEIIAGGLAVVTVALGTGATVYITSKKNKAIADAGLVNPKSSEYKAANTLIIDYGLRGQALGVDALKKEAERKARNSGDKNFFINYLSTGQAGHALANFWNISQSELAKKLGFNQRD